MTTRVLAILIIVATVLLSPVLYWLLHAWFWVWLPATAADAMGFLATIAILFLSAMSLGVFPLIEGRFPWE